MTPRRYVTAGPCCRVTGRTCREQGRGRPSPWLGRGASAQLERATPPPSACSAPTGVHRVGLTSALRWALSGLYAVAAVIGFGWAPMLCATQSRIYDAIGLGANAGTGRTSTGDLPLPATASGFPR